MKDLLSNKNKIIYGLAILIIIIGLIVIISKGFNVGIDYRTSQKIEIYIGKEFDINDIKSIVKEIFGKQEVSIKKVELYGDMVSISSKEITEDQKNSVLDKIKEKYELEDVTTSVESVPNVKLTDIAKNYILPIVISIAIIAVYSIVRFWKLNPVRVFVELILNTCIVEAVLASVLAILRLPICKITLPIALILYGLTEFIIIARFERNLSSKKEEESKN